jgi:hypothetical protein
MLLASFAHAYSGLMWSIGRSALRMKYSVNECFGSLYLEQGGMLVKKLVDASCIIFLGIQWINMEHRHGSALRKKYSVNECFGSLYLEQGGMLVKKLVDASCIIVLGHTVVR